MKRLAICLLFLLPLYALGDSIDDAEAKKRGVPVQQIQLENAQARVAELTKQVDALKTQLRAAQADAEVQRKTAEKLRADLQTANARLEQLTPANKLATGATPEVTAPQLEATGEKYVQKTVRMVGVAFKAADNDFVTNVNSADPLIGFSVVDRDGVQYLFAFASKNRYADLIVGLKRGQKLNLEGLVVRLNTGGLDWYGLICSKIEIAEAATKPDHAD
jgi:hypothetical protein